MKSEPVWTITNTVIECQTGAVDVTVDVHKRPQINFVEGENSEVYCKTYCESPSEKRPKGEPRKAIIEWAVYYERGAVHMEVIEQSTDGPGGRHYFLNSGRPPGAGTKEYPSYEAFVQKYPNVTPIITITAPPRSSREKAAVYCLA